MKTAAIHLDLEFLMKSIRKTMPMKPPKVEAPRTGKGSYTRKPKHRQRHEVE